MNSLLLFCLALGVVLTSAETSVNPDLEKLESLRIAEKNKELVLKFYQEVLGDKNFDGADKYIIDPGYIQHNPDIIDGREEMKSFFKRWLTPQGPIKIDIKRASAEGNLVWLHIRFPEPTTGEILAIIDVFRLENGKIVEHWDVIQPVPKNSVNPHPMF